MTRTALPALALALLAGCAPVREEVADGEGLAGDQLMTAMFAREEWPGSEYTPGYIFLVDMEYDCQSILWNWGLDLWSIPTDTQWVRANVYKGSALDWETTFRSQFDWSQDGQVWDTNVNYFQGEFGTGFGGGDDDDDVVPPDDPPEPRDVQGALGNTTGESLTIQSWDNAEVRGTISSGDNVWSFEAVNCGQFDGGVIGFDGQDSASDP